MGNVLLQLGLVSDKKFEKYKWEAMKQGRSSFAYAWILDQTSEERSRGITMDIAQSAFETKTKRVSYSTWLISCLTSNFLQTLCNNKRGLNKYLLK